MKKFIITAVMLALCFLGLGYAVYYSGFYIDFKPKEPITAQWTIKDKKIYKKNEMGETKEFFFKGVELSSGIAGNYATDYAVDKDTWLKWFKEIQEMGANTIRINTIYNDIFYNAFYEFNKDKKEPLYLLQGIQVSDYGNNSGQDAYNREFYDTLKKDSLDVVDITHGRKIITINEMKGSGNFLKDVSPWVFGYIIGNEWNAGTMAYTNNRGIHDTFYEGKYFKTTEDATAFETMLTKIMDDMVAYESKKYKVQRLISIINDPQNDPFEYEKFYGKQLGKYNRLDAEHILTTEELKSGFFASYRLYEFSPGFAENFSQKQKAELSDILPTLNKKLFYEGYTELLAKYHTKPVAIVRYGFSSARGAEDIEGPLTEEEQGQALASTYEDIVNSGCKGAIISTWQDVWERRAWNTSFAVNVKETYRWHDVQTNGQGYGLLSFESGNNETRNYVDGNSSEWEEKDKILESKGINLSARYDESYLYLLVEKEGIGEETPLYLPIDVTPKSGSTKSENPKAKFERAADFLLSIKGREESRILVQARYEAARENFLKQITGQDPFVTFPVKDSSDFVPINMICKNQKLVTEGMTDAEIITQRLFDTYETGKLVYGNGNPNSNDYNSLADFCFGDNILEVRIPWQLLNFYNPADMEVHDDYYENFGVEGLGVSELFVGASELNEEKPIPMGKLELKGWSNKGPYNQRLKKSYFILKERWRR